MAGESQVAAEAAGEKGMGGSQPWSKPGCRRYAYPHGLVFEVTPYGSLASVMLYRPSPLPLPSPQPQ